VEEETPSLRFRIGAIFFMILSLFLGYLASTFWGNFSPDGWSEDKVGFVILSVMAITYFFGSAAALFGNYRNGMKAIFIVNMLSFIIFLAIFLLFAWSYFNHPCYINPETCDDELTDSPFYLKACGLWVAVLALITFISWRLKRPPVTLESDQTDD